MNNNNMLTSDAMFPPIGETKKKTQQKTKRKQIHSETITSNPTRNIIKKDTINYIDKCGAVHFNTLQFGWMNMEIGDFMDKDCTLFSSVLSNSHTFNMLNISSQSLVWSAMGDINISFKFNSSNIYHTIEISKENIKSVTVYGNYLVTQLYSPPYIYCKNDSNKLLRMANSFSNEGDWILPFNYCNSLKFKLTSIIDRSNIPNIGERLYPTLFPPKLQFNSISNNDITFINSLIDQLPWSIIYHIYCLNTKIPGFIINHNVIGRFVEFVSSILKQDKSNIKFIEEACSNILLGKFIYPDEFMQIFECTYYDKKSNEHFNFTEYDESYFAIRKVRITPTTIKYYDKSYEIGNRVLRKYKDNIDNFTRITICDDDMRKLNCGRFSNLESRLRHIFKNGLLIGGRQFENLAYSPSQLRSHGCWFVFSEGGFNPTSIIQSLGDFSNIKTVAKYAARVGQCFSNTYNGINVDYAIVPDITINGVVFNDGCGRISPTLAREIASKLGITENGNFYVPSAFQFRMGGMKGVVVQDPEVYNHPSGKHLLISESQQKFVDNSSQFEILSYSKRNRNVTLNRLIISILSSNKLQDKAVLDLLDKDINLLVENYTNKENMIRLLRNVFENDITKNMKKSLERSQLTLGMQAKLHSLQQPMLDNFYQLDPFFSDCRENIILSKISDLKSGRIIVERAVLLIGVIDYYGVLEEGEVFVQLSNLNGFGDPDKFFQGNILSSNVAITRTPCLHPGDIRKFRAVSDINKIAKLSHLKDVVVFSQKGSTPAATNLSGGDYDGDLFQIYWEPSLLNFEEYEPMDYTPLQPIIKEEGCNSNDIPDFFLDFILHDNLGEIALSHIEHYDSDNLGCRSEKCKELAKYHSYQVDYAKTGSRLNLPHNLLSSSRPHYLPRSFVKNSYHSSKILGQIYDKIHSITNSISFKKDLADDSLRFTVLDHLFIKSKLVSKLFDNVSPTIPQFLLELYNDIYVLYFNYKQDLTKLLNQYHLKSEMQLITGMFDTKQLENRCGKNRLKLTVEIEHFTKSFVKFYRDKSISLIEKHEKSNLGYNFSLSKADIASIFYIITRDDNKEKSAKSYFGVSFYWLIIDLIN